MSTRHYLVWLLTLAIAAVAGSLYQWLGVPLPWMLGPLMIMASARLAGYGLQAPPFSRQIGQWLIGITLGLYFSPSVAAELVQFAPLLLIGAVFALTLGWLNGWLLERLTGIDSATALFASMPGGASEMAVLGARNGGRVDFITAAHSLRIAMVVLIIPPIVTLLDVHGVMPYTPIVREVDYWGLLALLLITALAGLLLQKLRWPNAWMLGALIVTSALALSGQAWSTLPQELSQLGQLLLGVALGSRFEPDFLKRAPRFMSGVAISVVFSLLLAAVFAWLMRYWFDAHPASLLLAAAPGGIAEMCITAQALALGVPLITAYHVFRVIVIITCTEPLWRRLTRHQVRT